MISIKLSISCTCHQYFIYETSKPIIMTLLKENFYEAMFPKFSISSYSEKNTKFCAYIWPETLRKMFWLKRKHTICELGNITRLHICHSANLKICGDIYANKDFSFNSKLGKKRFRSRGKKRLENLIWGDILQLMISNY